MNPVPRLCQLCWSAICVFGGADKYKVGVIESEEQRTFKRGETAIENQLQIAKVTLAKDKHRKRL